MSSMARTTGSGQINVLHYLSYTGMTGAEYNLMTLLEWFDRTKFNLMVTCATEGKEELLQRTSQLDIPVYRFASGDSYPGGIRRKFSLSRLLVQRIAQLTQLLRQKHIQILHVHAYGITGLPAFVAAVVARVPVIVVTHHGTIEWFLQNDSSALSKMTFLLEKHFTKRIITLYTKAARAMASYGVSPERILVLPYGVDYRRFQPIEHDQEQSQLFRLITVTRMTGGKGHEELVNAIHLLIERYPHLRLLLVGDGPTRPDIERQIQKLGLTGVVELAGRVPNAQIPALLQTAQVAILPSYMLGETLPVSLIEAMAAGLPAIGTRWVGIPDIIVDDETGILVEPKDVEGLAAAIERMVSAPELVTEMGHKARQRVQTTYTIEGMAQTLAIMYLEALSSSSTPTQITKRSEHTI